MKHVKRCEHYVREEIAQGHLDIQWVPSEEQVADGLTKPLEKAAFEKFVAMLGMVTINE